MSNRTVDAEAVEAEDVVDYLERWYHVPMVALAMVFMFFVRIQNYSVFRREEGVSFAAVDSWYHWRTTDWTVQNFPRTMPYEIYTGFPTGNHIGQFGTLFDQIVATVAVIIGLGDPSPETIQAAALITIPLLAALVAIPVYLIAAKLGGRLAGVIALVVLALAPSEFLRRSTTGQFQHHVAEVLFMAIAVLAIIVALRVVERDRPIWELVEAKDWEPLKEPAKYSALAGIAVCLYLWTWPPGVMLVGILGTFFAVHLCIDFLRGVSPDHVAFVGVVSLSIPTLFSLVMLVEWSTSITTFSMVHASIPMMVVLGCVFMAWLAREWDARDIERAFYPAAVAGIGLAGLLAMAIVLPDIFSAIVDNVTRRILPIGASETDATIQEAQPPADFVGRATREFGMGLYLMLIGLVFMAARPFVGQRYRAEHTLVIVWSLFLVSMAMTQVRFWYYFVLPVAIGTGYAVSQIVRWIDVSPQDQLRDVETYQIIVIVLVVGVLFVPFAPQIAGTSAVAVGDGAGPSHDSIIWEESNDWMNENTPELGERYGEDNADELDYYGTYDYPEDGDFQYPPGAYGVMSWWDYGHLITTQAERIPHANPFQQNAHSASAYLQAPGEETAEGALDLIAEGENARLDEFGELTREPPADGESHEEMAYVMIDYQMASSKFGAISQWTGPGPDHYVQTQDYDYGDEETQLPAFNDNYYDTQMASLYLEDADGMEGYRLVHENDDFAVIGGQLTAEGATAFGGGYMGASWEEAAQIAAQMNADREAGQVSIDGFYESHVVSSVKTFERVEGATLAGSVDEVGENATATATVEIETAPGRTFTYTQEAEVDENGDFELTVPYATENDLGPEDGYTDTSVEAIDDFQVFVTDDDGGFYAGETGVDEIAVYEGDTIAVDLDAEDPEEWFDDADDGEDGDEEDAADDDEDDDGDDDGEDDGADDADDGEE